MKTTVELADDLALEAERYTARHGLTLRAVIEEGIRSTLCGEGGVRSSFVLRDASVGGSGLQVSAGGVSGRGLVDDPGRRLRRAGRLTAVDTNVLVQAHRCDSRRHARAAECVRCLAEGRAAWAIPWPCLHEFLAIITHLRIFDPPSTLEEALNQIDAWMESPGLVILGEPRDHWSLLGGQLLAAQVRGPMVHDALARPWALRLPALPVTPTTTVYAICAGRGFEDAQAVQGADYRAHIARCLGWTPAIADCS